MRGLDSARGARPHWTRSFQFEPKTVGGAGTVAGMKVKAAVAYEAKKPLVIEEVDLVCPKACQCLG